MFTRTVDECRVLDVNELHREGFLEREATHARGTSTWYRDDEEVASIGYYRTPTANGEPALKLHYTVKPDSDSRQVEYTVPLDYTECHFGGERPWFRCPGRGCGERVGKLYKPPHRDHFLCRECHDLAYESNERQGEAVYENIAKPYDRLDAALTAAREEPFSRERLRELYDAKRAVREGHRTIMSTLGTDGWDGPDPLPPFDEWLDEMFHDAFGSPGGRPYGWFGRCEATAKTTGERCRQPAKGPHGKCHYHGGARGAGAPEGNDNAAD